MLFCASVHAVKRVWPECNGQQTVPSTLEGGLSIVWHTVMIGVYMRIGVEVGYLHWQLACRVVINAGRSRFLVLVPWLKVNRGVCAFSAQL